MCENKYRNTDRPLFILRYLMQHTDDEHKVSMADLLAYCQENGHGGSRHAISNDLDILSRYGFDIICTKEGNKNTYSYGCRQLDTAELRMLMDAVASSLFISPARTASLTKKLAQISGMHDAEKLCSSVYMGKQAKTINNSIFITIDIIHQAIIEGKKIKFQHTTYDEKRQRVLRNDGEIYTISPYLTVWMNDRYYMVGWVDNRKAIRSFRIDRMEIPQMTDDTAVPKPDDFDPDYYYQTMTKMASDGNESDIMLVCDNSQMSCMVDKFGDAFTFGPVDEKHFWANVHVATGRTFWAWVFEHSEWMKIAAPDSARIQYREMLAKAIEERI